ncbi:MAG: hypothetical protein R3277_04765 [Brumimicrobium sp.]|nr:hypothetical protein [Brumimicrobium sp.]
MEILNFIFRLGVVLAIFGFLWWLINLGLSLLRGGRKKMLLEAYIIKLVRYFFLVDVVMLFCLDQAQGNIDYNKTIIAGLILLIYFIGKIQNAQLRQSLFTVQGNMGMRNIMNQMKPVFDIRYESVVIIVSVLVFTGFIFYPQYAVNPISTWFYETIVDIEDTPIFGFIFKVIGFFFVISIIMKVVQGFTALLSGGRSSGRSDDDDDDSGFDDYTEVK